MHIYLGGILTPPPLTPSLKLTHYNKEFDVNTMAMEEQIENSEPHYPWGFVIGGILSLVSSFIVWLMGVGLAGFDLADQCLERGYPFDREYLSELHSANKYSKVFPLSSPCNAQDNLIPIWVNPAIIILAVGGIILLTLSVFIIVRCYKFSDNFRLNR